MKPSIINLICDKCKNEYQIKRKTYLQRQRKGNPNYCKECMKKYSTESANNTKVNMSDERKAEYRRKLSESNEKYWKELDNDIRESRFDQLRKQNDDLQKSWTPEKLKKHGKRISEGQNNMSTEAKATANKKRSKSMKNHHVSMTPEEKEIFSQQIKDGMDKMTPEEKEDMKQAWIDWWNGLSDDQKIEHLNPFHKGLVNSWEGASEEYRKNRIRKTIINSQGTNNFHQKFENYFINSHLSNSLYIKSEIPLSNKNIVHSWDYGIFNRNDELTAVVDLDGSYFHADECDYDGLHSKEEYDERRSLSIPNNSNIKYFIIQEYNFSKCFELIIKTLMMNYDEYVNNIFKMCRIIPFPEPRYSDKELIHSYNNLIKMKCNDKYHQDISLNTRLGDRLINHFHPSIYRANRKGNISPYDAWQDDELLKKCIKNRTIYQSYLNPNKILQGFNVSKIAQKVSVFSAGRAKLLINKYLSKFNEIFDPFSGFSGRMLGTVSLGKQYIGHDISLIHTNESNNMIKFLQSNGFDINATIDQVDILNDTGEYECLFTCPPYSDKEQWLDVPVDNRSCDDWIDECLSRYKCKRYLFIVDDTIKYKNYIVDIIKNKSHLNSNNEYIVLI